MNKIENLAYVLFILLMGFLWFMQPNIFPFNLFIVLLTIIPIIMVHLSKGIRRSPHYKKILIVLSNVKYSSLMFVVGIYFMLFGRFDKLSENIGIPYLIASSVAIIIFFLSLGYCLLCQDKEQKELDQQKEAEFQQELETIRNNTELLLTNSGITNIQHLIHKELSKYNCLVAIGNLMNLKTENGSKLLKNY